MKAYQWALAALCLFAIFAVTGRDLALELGWGFSFAAIVTAIAALFDWMEKHQKE